MEDAKTNNTPDYESIAAWQRRTGMSVTSIYEALGAGKLNAIKLGRKTLIDVKRGLHWLAHQPTWTSTGPVQSRSRQPTVRIESPSQRKQSK